MVRKKRMKEESCKTVEEVSAVLRSGYIQKKPKAASQSETGFERTGTPSTTIEAKKSKGDLFAAGI